MAKSLRTIAKESGISPGTLSRIANGKYKANPKSIIDKLLKSITGVNIPPDKFDEVLEMLDNARFPQKFQTAHRTAAWLYDNILQTKKSLEL
jgi:transcriptional regulator with XRE-family HTH domain